MTESYPAGGFERLQSVWRLGIAHKSYLGEVWAVSRQLYTFTHNDLVQEHRAVVRPSQFIDIVVCLSIYWLQ